MADRFSHSDQLMNDETTQNQRRSKDGGNSHPAVRKLQLLQVGHLQFGIFADEIAAIVEWREPAPLPHAPKAILGVVSFEGRMWTVMDAGTLIGREVGLRDAQVQYLIALRGDEQLALAIETLGENIEIAEADISAEPEAGEPPVLGVLHREGAEINILNPEELFSTAIQGRDRRRRRF